MRMVAAVIDKDYADPHNREAGIHWFVSCSTGFAGSSVNSGTALRVSTVADIFDLQFAACISGTLASVCSPAIRSGFSKVIHRCLSSWSAVANFKFQMRQRGWLVAAKSVFCEAAEIYRSRNLKSQRALMDQSIATVPCRTSDRHSTS